jgi:Tfp pilus assembly protein PilV
MKTDRLLLCVYRGRLINTKDGMTLVEVVIAMCLISLVCGGLYALNIKTMRFGEHNRLATEARSLAKERLEELISVGALNLAKPSCTMLNTDTNLSSRGYPIIRQPQIIWHAADGSVVASTNAAYAEIHMNVNYRSPLTKSLLVDSYPMILQK